MNGVGVVRERIRWRDQRKIVTLALRLHKSPLRGRIVDSCVGVMLIREHIHRRCLPQFSLCQLCNIDLKLQQCC
ncbi:Uncharacterised protein [Klebsiella pneumoniae]|nr:Uncharacterised protein [Klebsiella pneumoniae]